MILTPFDEYEVDTARTDAVAFGVGYLRVDAAGHRTASTRPRSATASSTRSVPTGSTETP
jgi:hypothetical protein